MNDTEILEELEKTKRMLDSLKTFIRINVMHGTFKTATIEDVNQWIAKWEKEHELG